MMKSYLLAFLILFQPAMVFISTVRAESFDYVAVTGSEDANPLDSSLFIAAVSFSPSSLPSAGTRQILVQKFDLLDSKNPVGWGIALSRSAGKVRPQVYWKPDYETGGWFTFAPVAVAMQKECTLILVAHPNNFVSIYYLTKLESAFLTEDEPHFLMQFVGANPLTKTSTPHDRSVIQLGSLAGGARGFEGKISRLIVGAGDAQRFQRSKFMDELSKSGVDGILASQYITDLKVKLNGDFSVTPFSKEIGSIDSGVK